MCENPKWASLAILDFHDGEGFLIETLTITENNCTLSGAWSFKSVSAKDFKSVISDRLLINLAKQTSFKPRDFNCIEVSFTSFLADAAEKAAQTNQMLEEYLSRNEKDYKNFMQIPPNERKLVPKVVKKKLEPMYLNDWTFEVDEINPQSTLITLGKQDSIAGTPREMVHLIQFSWLTKHIIEKWLSDESERSSKRYLDPTFAEIRILPKTWFEEMQNLKINR